MVNYNELSLNETPEAIAILRQYFKKINWHNLAYNKCNEAIEFCGNPFFFHAPR